MTLAEAQESLAAYKAARVTLLAGGVAEVRIGGHSHVALSLADIEGGIDKYESIVADLSGPGPWSLASTRRPT